MTVKDDYWGGNWKYLMQYTLAFARWNQCAVKIFIWQMILWFDRIIEQFSSVLVLLMLIFRCVMTKSRIYVKIVTVMCKRFCSPLYLYDCCHLTTLITVKLCTIMYYYVNNPPMEAIPYRFFAQSFELFSAQQIWNSRSISAGCQTFNLCRVLPPSQNKTNLPSQTKPLPAKRSVDLVDIILNFSIHASDACKELLKVVSQ